jgi:hypothetical protein
MVPALAAVIPLVLKIGVPAAIKMGIITAGTGAAIAGSTGTLATAMAALSAAGGLAAHYAHKGVGLAAKVSPYISKYGGHALTALELANAAKNGEKGDFLKASGSLALHLANKYSADSNTGKALGIGGNILNGSGHIRSMLANKKEPKHTKLFDAIMRLQNNRADNNGGNFATSQLADILEGIRKRHSSLMVEPLSVGDFKRY